MNDTPMKLHYKIGAIEFDAEGAPEDVEKQRRIFVEGVLPSAVDAMKKTQDSEQIVSASLEQRETILLAETTQDDKPNKCAFLPDSELDRMSLASFIKKMGEITEITFTLAAAYFTEKKTGEKNFSNITVKQWYAEARRIEPKNVSVSLNVLAKKGYIMDDPASKGNLPKNYIITDEGIGFIEKYEPKTAKNGEKKKTMKARKSSETKHSQYESINIDDLHLDNYPQISKYKDTKDKVTLLMYIITTESQCEWFTVNDLMLLLVRKLGESLTEGQIKGVFRHHPRWFLIDNVGESKKEKKYKLLNEGKQNVEKIIEEWKRSNQ